MEANVFPTKSNLLASKNTLSFSKQGYDLLDKKRNILIHELMTLIDSAKSLQAEIAVTFENAHKALQRASIIHGASFAERAGGMVTLDSGVNVVVRSVMGAQIPSVTYSETASPAALPYSLHSTSPLVDEVRLLFSKAKSLAIQLSMVETSAYRLAINISKTQKRANALKNIVIPRYEELIHYIREYLEEKEREDFGRLKVIKGRR